MFKRLGIFAILAVCLFAIVIVMGGCDPDDPPPPPPIVPPVETKVETPMEKLAGSYSLVEAQAGNEPAARPPGFSGKMFLFTAGGSTYTMSLGPAGNQGHYTGTWSADQTHLTFDGDRFLYTWDGTHLTFSIPDPNGGPETLNLKWRQTLAY